MIILTYYFWAFLVSSTYAHCDECEDKQKICAFEILDPTNLVTFESREKLKAYNIETPDDEYEFLYDGKCDPLEECPLDPICTIPKPDCCGEPKTFKNFCELHKWNLDRKGSEYEYYHDEDCNDVATAITDSCENCVCEDKIEEVCAIPADYCGKPETVASYCKLQKWNCDHPDKQKLYFHDGACYDDKRMLN